MNNTEIKKAIEVLRKASEKHERKYVIEEHLEFIKMSLYSILSFEDWLRYKHNIGWSDTFITSDFIDYYNKYNDYLKSFEDKPVIQEEKKTEMIEVRRDDLEFFNNLIEVVKKLKVVLKMIPYGYKTPIDIYSIDVSYQHVREENCIVARLVNVQIDEQINDFKYKTWYIEKIEFIENTTTNQVYKLID